nr:Flp family type IVb pilin [Robiginitomaculum antarcticum]
MKSFVADESGATAIEYGLIAALIAVGIIAAGGLLGNTLADQFNSIAGEVESAGSGNFSG